MTDKNTSLEPTETISFDGFVLGLSGAALSYLGLLDKESLSTPKNLHLAKQNIEILAMLAEKTKGNLSIDEDKLLKSILLDLRVKFVEVCKAEKKS
jgi:hypothetical protein